MFILVHPFEGCCYDLIQGGVTLGLAFFLHLIWVGQAGKAQGQMSELVILLAITGPWETPLQTQCSQVGPCCFI